MILKMIFFLIKELSKQKSKNSNQTFYCSIIYYDYYNENFSA